VALPARAQAHAASRALEAIARQPDEATIISRNLYIGLAMIESQALYVLIVALILLFANPLAGHVQEAVAAGGVAPWFLLGSAVVATLTIIIGTMASSLGQGRVTGTALESIAEQPAARDSLSTTLFISLALLESLALYALIVALILLFANPLVERVLPR
jgi:F-type H+-transporting ATPase subunit c